MYVKIYLLQNKVYTMCDIKGGTNVWEGRSYRHVMKDDNHVFLTEIILHAK